MKKIIISLGFIALALGATAQVKIKDGTVTSGTTPNTNAILELESNNKGLLCPRVSLTATNAVLPGRTMVAGMVVYNTNTTTGANGVTPGVYYSDGTQWVRTSGKSDWLIFGNANSAVNGTPAANTDSQYVMGRVAIGTNTAPRIYSTAASGDSAHKFAYLTVNGDAYINGITVGNGGNSNNNINTVFGYSAFYMNTTGYYNVAIGNQTLTLNTSGEENTAIGSGAMEDNTSGNQNAAVGAAALQSNTSGYYNTALGYEAEYLSTTGYSNTMIGSGAGYNLTIGNNNIALGRVAGANLTTGSYNIAIGTVNIPNATGNYQLNIGNAIYGTNVNNGNASIGINTANPSYTFQVNGTAAGTSAWQTTSDARYKQDVQPLTGSLDKVLQLRGITFNWNRSYAKEHGLNVDSLNHIGFLAQEVEKIFPQVVTTGKDENHSKAVSYSDLVPVLAEAIKEQQKEIKTLQAQNEKLQAEIDALKK